MRQMWYHLIGITNETYHFGIHYAKVYRYIIFDVIAILP